MNRMPQQTIERMRRWVLDANSRDTDHICGTSHAPGSTSINGNQGLSNHSPNELEMEFVLDQLVRAMKLRTETTFHAVYIDCHTT